jgi:hypothetical protein
MTLSLLTYFIKLVYLLNFLGYGHHNPDLLAKWAYSWWAPLSCSSSLVSRDAPLLPQNTWLTNKLEGM